jgi:hypothetical protein
MILDPARLLSRFVRAAPGNSQNPAPEKLLRIGGAGSVTAIDHAAQQTAQNDFSTRHVPAGGEVQPRFCAGSWESVASVLSAK